jgi:hypothetical protein
VNWSKEQLQAALKNNPDLKVNKNDVHKLDEVKTNKFHAQAVVIDGHKFPSLAEAERYGELLILKAAGVIKDFELQPSFDIGAGMKYTADFGVTYMDEHVEYEEVKGHWTEPAKMRVKLFREKYPDKILKIIRNGEVVEG